MCSQIENDPQTGFYCTKLTWCMFLKGKTIIWLTIYGSHKILKIQVFFCARFSCQHHFRHRYQSGLDYSEMKNDADLIFIVVWQASKIWLIYLILDGGSYNYIDFKKWSYQILSSIFSMTVVFIIHIVRFRCQTLFSKLIFTELSCLLLQHIIYIRSYKLAFFYLFQLIDCSTAHVPVLSIRLCGLLYTMFYIQGFVDVPLRN